MAVCLAACLPSCMLSRQGGGGSETMIGVAGKVVDAGGNAMAGVEVRIRPEGALPSKVLGVGAEGEGEPPTAVTQPDGSYRIEGVTPGNYLVECRDAAAGAALLTARVSDSLERLPDAVLRPTGAIKGRILLPSGSDTSMTPFMYVYVPGLAGRVVLRDRDWRGGVLSFLLTDIPAGRHLLRVQPAYLYDLSRMAVLEIPGVEVLPGDTLDLGPVTMPWRSDIRDSAYTRDSLALAAILRANGFPDPNVPSISAVSGNRVTMLFDFNGRINTIPAEVQALDRLEVLYLMGGAGYPPGSEPTLQVAPEFASIRGLKRLWLFGYKVAGLPDWARSFSELASLQLASVGLETFPSGVEDYAFLAYLDLRGNAIPSLPASLARLKRLRVMDMSDNELTDLPRELLGMGSLRGFRARGNRLCDLDAERKAWLTRQDSLWIVQADPLSYYPPPVDSGWEASQRCGTP